MKKLNIQLKGEITSSNFEGVKMELLERIDNIPTNLVCDADFEQAKEHIKLLGEDEKTLKKGLNDAISHFPELQELKQGVEEIAEKARQKRLSLTKLSEVEKQKAKDLIVSNLASSVAIEYQNEVKGRITSMMKGKSSLSKIEEEGKELVSDFINQLKQNLQLIDSYVSKYGKIVCPNAQGLAIKEYSEVKNNLESQVQLIENNKLKQEAERLAKMAREKSQEESHKENIEQGNYQEVTPLFEQDVINKNKETQNDDFMDSELEEFEGKIIKALQEIVVAGSYLQNLENIKKFNQFKALVNDAYNNIYNR